MTADQNELSPIETVLQIANKTLTIPRYNMLREYIERGGKPLAPDTASKFFELYLNGSEPEEIHRLNKSFPYEAILWASIKYNWQLQRDEYILALQSNVKEKVIKAQLETTSLLTDMLTAANKHHGDKIKKYIQTGDPNDLKGSMNIESIVSLLKVVDGLQKITGQSNTHKVKTESTQTLNLNVKSDDSNLDADTAAKILAVVAESKRNKK